MSIALPLYYDVMPGMEAAIEEVRAAEAIVAPARNFEISLNRGRPYIESVEKKALVNILLKKVETDSERSSKHQKVHKGIYHFDMYVRGTTTDLEPADESSMLRLLLLSAQVESALTAMKNQRFGLTVGKIDRRIALDLEIYPFEDPRESASTYAPARFTMECFFPYSPSDLELPDLESLDIKMLEDWNTKFIYPPHP